MSRFFVGGSDSESESEDERSSGSEEDTPVRTRVVKGGADSSDEDDAPKKRVIKSARDKQFDELKDTIKSVKNATNINDWNKIQDEFDNLNRQLAKASQLVQKEGVPKFYIKALIELEDAIKDVVEKKPKMNATNTKSFNSMKQKVKKNNLTYQKEIEEQRKNPNAESDQEKAEESEESDSEEEEKKATPKVAPKAAAKPAKPAKVVDEDSGSDSDDWGDDDDDDDSSSEDENDGRVNKWFLPPQKIKELAEKKKLEAEKKEQEKDENQKQLERKERAKKAAEAKEAGAIAKADEKKPIEMSTEEVKTKLKEVLSNRGKRNTDPTKQTEKLNDLLSYAKNPELQVEILTHLVSAQFDSGRGIASYMPVAQWKSCYNNLIQILSILEHNPEVQLHEAEELVEQSADADEEETAVKAVAVNLVAFIERLDDELTKSFQAIDPHTQEYVQRLQDENSLLDLMEKTQDYYMRKSKFAHAAHVAARRTEHIYYKLDAHTSEDKSDKAAAVPEPGTAASADAAIKAAGTATRSNKDLIEKLASLVLAHGDERLKTRVMLCHIYYYALHDRFYEARDMMLMSHLQDSIIHMDISTQILFNRTQVQIGLCAFRNNLIKNAYNCLAEVHAGGRVKELLAQGITTRHNEKSAEQEKQERKRQLPYHMHINLELLEAVHLICAMLLEVPNTAAHAFDVKKKVTSRFDKLLEFYDRQVFTGPPEDTRNMILAASKNLSKGDWKKCEEQLLGLSVWNLVHSSDQVKSMLRRKIQEEGLRTYVFTFSPHYKSMSLQTLSDMFELPKNNVHSIISKMMINEELHASWDQPTGAIVMHGVEPSRLQYLAMQLADKAAGFVEVNERNSDPRSATGVGYGYNKYDNKGQKGDQRKGDNRNRRDNNNEGRDNRRDGQDRRKGGDRGGDRNDRQDRGDRREQRDNKQRNAQRNK